MARTYKNVATQLIHYLGRIHDGMPPGPIEAESAWKGADLAQSDAWRLQLTGPEVAEVRAALQVARQSGKPMGKLTRRDFPLPTLGRSIEQWREILTRGRGFVLISGLPVQEWTTAESEMVFWCLGTYLGHRGAQNNAGELLGHVRDITGNAASTDGTRLYKTSADIAYHCDAADVVGLLCLQQAPSGGQSRLVSSVSVFNELLRRAPDLAPRLFEPFELDTVDEGVVAHFPVRPCAWHKGVLRTFYHSDYFRSVERHPDVTLTADQRALLDLYDEVAASPDLALTMDLRPGDMQFVSNHVVLHSRTAYVDATDPARKRHLLRLWLSIEEPAGLVERGRKMASSAALVRDVARQKLGL